MADNRCMVTGIITDASGRPLGNRRVSIKPAAPAFDPETGDLYVAEEVRTKTLANGLCKIALVPSAVVGPYTVKAVGLEATAWVPSQRSCSIAEAIAIAEAMSNDQ